ncbi:inositol-1-monophosphatase ImpA domain protein [Mycobacterium xenopi 3993]|nr:inositol-1-monophosphatase ImpA domain protein [Mycobacterium xenopi 3993]
MLENLSRVSSRLRMHGATGIDLAYVADGILGGRSVSATMSGTTRPG